MRHKQQWETACQNPPTRTADFYGTQHPGGWTLFSNAVRLSRGHHLRKNIILWLSPHPPQPRAAHIYLLSLWRHPCLVTGLSRIYIVCPLIPGSFCLSLCPLNVRNQGFILFKATYILLWMSHIFCTLSAAGEHLVCFHLVAQEHLTAMYAFLCEPVWDEFLGVELPVRLWPICIAQGAQPSKPQHWLWLSLTAIFVGEVVLCSFVFMAGGGHLFLRSLDTCVFLETSFRFCCPFS